MQRHKLRFVRAVTVAPKNPVTRDLYADETQSTEQSHLAHTEHLANLRQDRKARKIYGHRLFWLIVGWLGAVVVIVVLHGFSAIPFTLTTAALTTLIAGATASVIGLFAIVATYLFPKR